MQENPSIPAAAPANRLLAASADDWLAMNRSALGQLVTLPDVVGMDYSSAEAAIKALAEDESVWSAVREYAGDLLEILRDAELPIWPFRA